MPCPRWDSNGIPGLADTGSGGNMRDPGQSGGSTGQDETRRVDSVHTSISPIQALQPPIAPHMEGARFLIVLANYPRLHPA